MSSSQHQMCAPLMHSSFWNTSISIASRQEAPPHEFQKNVRNLPNFGQGSSLISMEQHEGATRVAGIQQAQVRRRSAPAFFFSHPAGQEEQARLRSERLRQLERLQEALQTARERHVLLCATEADSRASARLAAEWAAEAALRESLYARDSAAVAADCENMQREKNRLAEAEQHLAKRREKTAALAARVAAVAAGEQRAVREAEEAERQARDGETQLSANRLRLREATVRQQSAAATLDVLREDHEEELARMAEALAAARQQCAGAAALSALIRLCRGLEANRDAAVQQVRALRVAAKARTRQ